MKYGLWFILIFLVVIRFLVSQPVYKDGQKIRITATVSLEPIVYSDKQRLVLENLKIYLPRFPEIHYGDSVVVEGTVKIGELEKPKLISHKVSTNFLMDFRKSLIGFWQRALPEPHSALVAGITLGYKSGLPPEFWNALKNTGTTHVVVASGMNVTFVASFLMTLLILFIERHKAVFVTILGILAYCFITGFEAPIVRAAIMGSFVFLAQGLGRISQILRLACFSALIMLIIKPTWLTDVGFILSFGSTISLILFETKISTKLRFVPGIFRESLSTSVSAQIGVAPILFVTFGQFNLLSPLVNVLVLWVVPLIMIISTVGGVVGLIVPGLGQLIIYLVYPLTSWFVWTTQMFANI